MRKGLKSIFGTKACSLWPTLPCSIALNLLAYSEPEDIYNLLNTCNALRCHLYDEDLCRELCARYGILKRSNPEPEVSFTWSEIYRCLLHKYRRLLGLWASDFPYQGGILEFRVSNSFSIVGRQWCFDSKIKNPYAVDCWINLRRDSEGRCYSKLEPYNVRLLPTPIKNNIFLASKEVKYATSGAKCGGLTIEMPDFPSKRAPWYDADRPLPPISNQINFTPSSSRSLTREEIASKSFIYPVSGSRTPPALSIRYLYPDYTRVLSFGDYKLHDFRFFLTDDKGDNFNRDRYYPLRNPPIPSFLPFNSPIGSPAWDPQCLEGLWIGHYAESRQVLYLEWAASSREVKAWKVTGDMSIPRGLVGWHFNIDQQLPKIKEGSSVFYAGKESVALPGFMYVSLHLQVSDFGLTSVPVTLIGNVILIRMILFNILGSLLERLLLSKTCSLKS